MSNGGIIGLIAAGVVAGLVVGTVCVYKIYKADSEDPSMAYASKETKARAHDAAQAQAEAETEVTTSQVNREIKAEKEFLEGRTENDVENA
ncbi:MAG: hypothetical protein SGARI_006566 [Bacillariaceae sp.]